MGERRRGRLERRRSLDELLSSDTDQWLTPLDFLAVLLRLGPVVFDPCGNPLSVVPAARQVLQPSLWSRLAGVGCASGGACGGRWGGGFVGASAHRYGLVVYP